MVKVKCKSDECEYSQNGYCTAKIIQMEFELNGPESMYHHMKCGGEAQDEWALNDESQQEAK